MKRHILMIAMFLGCLSAAKGQSPQVVDDGKPMGFVYFEDKFNWIIASMGGEDHLGGNFGKTGPRVDGLPENFAARWKASGWTTPSKFVYVRLGYVQVGRSSDAGDIISPKMNAYANDDYKMIPARAGIEEGKVVNVKVSFDLTIFRSSSGKKDDNPITFEVLNAGVLDDTGMTENELTVENWNKWKNYTVTVYGATSETRFRIKSGNLDRESGASRFFLDNFKVEKVK